LRNSNSWLGLANVTLNAPTEDWFDLKPANEPQGYYRVVSGPVSIP
jgi:hypothetical protein